MHDKRRYVRMGTVFPVEFTIADEPAGEGGQGRLHQGFTRDVSEGGMCIEFKSFGKETEAHLSVPNTTLSLIINPPFSRTPIIAQARVAWIKKQDLPQPPRYFIGVAYTSIDVLARKRLIAYAHRLIWIPRITAVVGIVMLAGLVAFSLHTQKLTRENRKLLGELREVAAKRSQAAGELITLADERMKLEEEYVQIRQENTRLENTLKSLNAETTADKALFESQLLKSRKRENEVRTQLERTLAEQKELRRSYQALPSTQEEVSGKAIDWMSHWLSSHVNAQTGLIASFEGDPALEDAAFTYDQALAAQAFLLTGEKERAEAILSFFDKLPPGGPFVNAYDAHSGAPQESVVHTGPNIWIGIAALQHSAVLKERRFVPLALRVGDWALSLQDKEGGLPGGPDVSWYSTEHNLDGYAFFGLLFKITGQEKYREAQSRALAWLKKYAYSNKSQAVNRGKGDGTIATDTFAWSIAALGPAKLIEMGFDPEGILDFAEKNCAVTVDFTQPDGKTVKVSGFDFAKAKNVGRGGIVSTEWTAQMIVSYQVMARYLVGYNNVNLSRRYTEKADFYLSELQKMFITSPSRTGQGRGCLPYASADNVETGHGWRTPQGSRTGSVAGTAYGLFAWKGYNPFEPAGGDPNAFL